MSLHVLTEVNKLNSMEKCQDMLVEFLKRGAKEKVVVIDEKWIYFRDVRPKESDRAWISSAGDTPFPIQARRTISDKKVLIILACNYSKSFAYYELLDDGHAVDS